MANFRFAFPLTIELLVWFLLAGQVGIKITPKRIMKSVVIIKMAALMLKRNLMLSALISM